MLLLFIIVSLLFQVHKSGLFILINPKRLIPNSWVNLKLSIDLTDLIKYDIKASIK